MKQVQMIFILSDKTNQIIEQETAEKDYHKLVNFTNPQVIPESENIIILNKVHKKDNLDIAYIRQNKEDQKM